MLTILSPAAGRWSLSYVFGTAHLLTDLARSILGCTHEDFMRSTRPAIIKFILNISGRTSPLWQYAAPGVLIENVTLLPNTQCQG